jgi:hypothetical protein
MRRPALLLLVMALLVMALLVSTFLPHGSTIMTAVPAHGLTPPPANQPIMPEFSQVFGVGSGAPAQCSNHGVSFACSFGSNRNYFFNANGTNLINATTAMSLSGPLDGASVGGGNWSYQMNMYSPAAFTVASYMQCVLTNYGPESGNLVIAQDYWVAANDFVPIRASGQTVVIIPQSEYVPGFSMRIEAVTNSTGYVVGCQYNANAANGASLMNEYVPLSEGVLNSGAFAGAAWQNYSAPTVGFETHLIGSYNGETANFSRASGTLTNTASTPMGWTATDPDAFSWVSYKGSGTVEKSNIGYFEPALLAAPIPSTSTTKTTTETTTVTATVVSTASPETVTQTETTTLPAMTTTLTNSQIRTQTVTSTTALTSSSVPTWAYVTMSILLIAGIATGYIVRRRPVVKR